MAKNIEKPCTMAEKRAAIALLNDEPAPKARRTNRPKPPRAVKPAQHIKRAMGEPTSDVMPQLDTTDRVMTVEEYAEFTHVSPQLIYAQCRGGGITGAVKFGGTWRIVVKDRRDTGLADTLTRLNETLAAFVKFHEEGVAFAPQTTAYNK